ncbi:hypothetical protein FIBSPDRAFT_925287 [Athelia psychrophila]|uniref:Uncharacterized protein n=1 Tax=Athelia psychrophila TaxID=1759441 RepID=A0A166V4S6_9AGAM|nr:hypothetical protein FIBSPDRAFT_925287 [Fibularhizoctonia sp. CBS 109695]
MPHPHVHRLHVAGRFGRPKRRWAGSHRGFAFRRGRRENQRLGLVLSSIAATADSHQPHRAHLSPDHHTTDDAVLYVSTLAGSAAPKAFRLIPKQNSFSADETPRFFLPKRPGAVRADGGGGSK